MYIKVERTPDGGYPFSWDAVSILEINSTTEEPVYQLGGHVLVVDSKIKTRDHVAVELKNGRNLIAVYAGEQDGTAFFHRFSGHPTVQHIDLKQIKSMKKIMASLAPGFGSF